MLNTTNFEGTCFTIGFSVGSSVKGTVPARGLFGILQGFSKLKVLKISSFLTGSVPTTLGGLRALTHLELNDIPKLNGTIPTEIGQLTNLAKLVVRKVPFTGSSFPSEVGQLTNLSSLILLLSGRCGFDGSVPATLGNLSSLTTLQLLNVWRLGGSLPEFFFRLTELRYLVLSSNSLTGPVLSFRLPNLVYLALHEKSLTGPLPSSIQCLTGLTTLKLNNNQFSNKLPTEIGALTALENLEVWKNRFTGPLPYEIGFLTNLKSLNLHENQFSGSLPTSIGNMLSLTKVEAWKNRFTGPLPYEIGFLTNLKELNIYDNKFSNSLPASVGNCTNLRRIMASNNSFNGTLPSLENLLGLTSLLLSYNNLSNSLPTQLFSLTKLKELSLNYNSFTGQIPTYFQRLRNLQNVNLDKNCLTGSIPDIWASMMFLRKFSAAQNKLNGTLPNSLMSLPSLRELYLLENKLTGHFNLTRGIEKIDLGYNKLSGSLPLFPVSLKFASLISNRLTGTISPDIFNGSCVLDHLDLMDNRLIGSIPDRLWNHKSFTFLGLLHNSLVGSIDSNVGSLKGLEVLMLGVNPRMGGSIPSEIGLLTELKILNIRSMGLSGTIPSTLGDLGKLILFNVSGNSLTGTLPSELGRLTRLEQLSVYMNSLTGSLPSEFSKLTKLKELFLYENFLTGSVDLLFQDINFPSLEYLDMSNNKFGPNFNLMTVPPKLKSFAAYINCFNGAMNINKICDAEGLETLLLDGISDEFTCVRSYLSAGGTLDADYGVFNTRIQKFWKRSIFAKLDLNLAFNSYHTTSLSGTFPSCIFHLEHLRTLHLSGNNLRGELPNDFVRLPANLTSIRLSYNYLKGAIPLVLQKQADQLSVLDLSANRFYGSIEEMAAPNNSIYLFGNRLSGRVSRAIVEARFENVSILSGNLFTCDLGSFGENRNLPERDPQHKRFQCGSNNVDFALYVFLGFGLSVVLLVVCQVVCWNRFRRLQMLFSRNFFRDSTVAHRSFTKRNTDNDEVYDLRESVFFGRISLLPPNLRPKSDKLPLETRNGLNSIEGSFRSSSKKIKEIVCDDLHAMNFIFLLSDLRAISIFFGVVSVFLLLPMYLMLKLAHFNESRSYATFAQEYSWTASGIFLTGLEPAIIACFIWTVLLVVAFLLFHHAFKFENSKHETALQQAADKLLQGSGANETLPPSTESESRKHKTASLRAWAMTSSLSKLLCDFSRENNIRQLRRIGLWSRILLRNLIIAFIACALSLSLNFSYVYLYQFKDLDSSELRNLQIFTSICKLLLGRIVPFLQSLRFLTLGLDFHEMSKENDIQVFLSIFNTILAPFIATMATEQNCFYLAFKGTEPVYLTYKLPSLATKQEYLSFLAINETSEKLSETIFYQTSSERKIPFFPPFIYYYQCSSSLIKIYAAPLIFAAIIKIFLYPIGCYILRYFLDSLPASDDFRLKSSDEEARPRLGPREALRYVLIGSMPKIQRTDSERDEILILHKRMGPKAWSKGTRDCCSGSNGVFDENAFYFFDATAVLLDVYQDILILLTFGVLCPLLALVLISAIVVRCTRWQYICENVLRGDSEISWEGLNVDCARAWKRQKNVLFRLRWMVVALPSLFFTMFVYDIAKDDYLEDGGTTTKKMGKVLTCIVAILPLALSFVLARAAPSFFASAAQQVVRGDFGIADLVSRFSDCLACRQRPTSKGNPSYEQDRDGGVTQNNQVYPSTKPTATGEAVRNPLSQGCEGEATCQDGIELVELVQQQASSTVAGQIDLSDDYIRDTIPARVNAEEEGEEGYFE